MFRHFENKINRKIEKQTQKLEEQQELEQLRLYLNGYGHDRIRSPTLLAPGQVLMSKSKNYFAVVEAGGNFSIYVSSHFVKQNRIWTTHTEGKGPLPVQVGLQDDGHLIVLDGNMKHLWKSEIKKISQSGHGHGHHGHHSQHGHKKDPVGPFTLFMDDDGNLIIFDQELNQVWESGTSRGTK